MKIHRKKKGRFPPCTHKRARHYNEFDIDPEWSELDEETLKLSALGEWPKQ